MRFIYSTAFRRVFVIFAFIALLVILDATGNLSLIKNSFFKTYGSAAASLNHTSNKFNEFFEVVFTIKRLVSENARLNQQINELSFENARLQSAKQENIALRKALNFSENSSFTLLPVAIKFSDPTGLSQTIVIDKGEHAGVRLKSAVIVAPGLLIGQVTKLYSNTAEVTLITDPSTLINGEISDSGAKGLIRGEHGLGLIFDLVTQNEVIKTGDKIITSGLTDDLPKGLLIGEISGIHSAASELFQKAFVVPAADLRNLHFLFVIQ